MSVTSSICFSSYVIRLKDGREFATDRYWEEGDQIKGIEEIKDLPNEQEAMAKQTASLTAEKGSVRRKHSKMSLITRQFSHVGRHFH